MGRKKNRKQMRREVPSRASKRGTGERGEPDSIHANEKRELPVLLENKSSVNDHESKREDNPVKYAVDGVIWHLKFLPMNIFWID